MRIVLTSLTHLRDRQGWRSCLEEHCAELKGHRLVWRKDADPYRVKLVRTIRARQVRAKNMTGTKSDEV